MPNSYLFNAGGRAPWRMLALLACLLGSLRAQAQSGPYGNEWIVQGQPYYKVKVWQDGIYRLNSAYLSQLGAGAVAPAQLQVWRRGKEVAVYQGGNSAALDATTYLEFFGQRNDAAMDREFYKDPTDQANPHYSLYTDTAAYFITWGSRAGKRMVQPVAAGNAPHGWRLQSSLVQKVQNYAEGPSEGHYTHMPWLEPGEGFFCGLYYSTTSFPLDTLLRSVSTAAGTPAPRLELTLVGSTWVNHLTNVGVVPPGAGASRNLGTLTYTQYHRATGRYLLQPTDISSAGQVTIECSLGAQPPQSRADAYRYSWWRVTAAQQNVWFANRRQVFFQNDSLLTGVATYELPNVPATVYGYDVHDPWNVQRIAPTAAQTLTGARYVFPSASPAQTRRLLLADVSRTLAPPAARRVTFRAINPVTPNFVIITHPRLMGAATATTGPVPNAARAYANYRASTAGGRYDTLMVTAPQLYDQFFYGERSVLALRHFALWLATNAPAAQVKHLLLLGKGMAPGYPVTNSPDEYSGDFGLDATPSTRIQGEQGVDLVPTSTRSYSDIFLSSDWPHDNFVPALATGRVAATTSQQVMDYLNKLVDYESQLSPNQLNPDFWHKQAINLVGGQSVQDFAEFGGYMDMYKKRMESPLWGGQVTTFRNANPNVPPTFNLSPQANAGLGLITYFGHGSLTDFNVNIGDVTNPADGYANLHRYPVMMYNGCFAGICFFNIRTFATDWLLAADKGAVGMMAETGYSFPYPLHLAQDRTYQLLLNDAAWFGKPIAEVRREVIRQLQSNAQFAPATSPYGYGAAEQLLCTVWQGDPALTLFAPAKPDLVVSNTTLSLNPIAPDVTINAASARFTLSIGVSNPARITRDSVEIRVTRTYPNTSGNVRKPDVYTFNNHTVRGTLYKPFPQAFQRDTTYAVVLPDSGDVSGLNTFKVELDYRNKIAELNESNNTATISYSFLRPGLTLLSPTEFAIVGSTPQLVAQNNNTNAATRGYDFQVDSVATFNSPGLRRNPSLQAGAVASWTPSVLTSVAGRYSQVWYWRARFTNPVGNEDTTWQVSSFRIIPNNTAGGWSQSHNGQFRRDQVTSAAVAAPSNRWSFTTVQHPVQLTTQGGTSVVNNPTFNLLGSAGIYTDPANPPALAGCSIYCANITVAVLDPLTLRRVTVPGPNGAASYNICGQAGQEFYNFGSDADTVTNLNNSAFVRGNFTTFLQNVPNGSVVLMISQNRLRYAEPALAPVLQQLATTLGSRLITTLKNGEPWAIVARKYSTGGQLLAELGPSASSTTPANNQVIQLRYSLLTPAEKGSVVSTLIGPAQKWQTLMNTIVREDSATANTSKYRLSLYGVDASNHATLLKTNIGHQSVDLTAYPVATYPYMRLQLTLADTVNRVPPQLKQWLITYKGLPEGIVRRDLVAATSNGVFYDPTRLASLAADSGYVRIPVRFDNVSLLDFAAPLQAQVTILDAKGVVARYPDGTPVQKTVTAAPGVLAAGGSAFFWVKLNMIGVFGTFTAQVFVNPQVQPEQNYGNNYLTLSPFSVGDTNVPPTLDVAVDGRHILDGELVSPTPVINIQLKDEDKLRHITDASYFTLYLQKGTATPTTVNLTGSQVQFSVDNTNGSLAKLVYQPGQSTPLTDGVYTLRVQGKDPSNAKAGTVDYLTRFEVVNASTITNVYPYPNPITSKARFVFTVTGQELPRNMKIQIMTITGKVVREIFMNELGPLHIGNNVTDYAWDGTDQYGDRLANGTYLYRVALDDASGQFTHRATAGDKAFANDWGKLVLIR